MNTKLKITSGFQDVKINVKTKLSALWIALMFCYTYADILGFYAPGNIEELIAGEIAGIQMTQGLLLGSAVLMAIPSAMIFLSLALKAKANRLVNIIAGLVYLAVLGSTFLTGRNPSKTKRSVGNPDTLRAVMAAVGPGTAITGMASAMASLTSRKAGSEIAGVPASDTTATDKPCCSMWMSRGICLTLL